MYDKRYTYCKILGSITKIFNTKFWEEMESMKGFANIMNSNFTSNQHYLYSILGKSQQIVVFSLFQYCRTILTALWLSVSCSGVFLKIPELTVTRVANFSKSEKRSRKILGWLKKLNSQILRSVLWKFEGIFLSGLRSSNKFGFRFQSFQEFKVFAGQIIIYLYESEVQLLNFLVEGDFFHLFKYCQFIHFCLLRGKNRFV